jgi:hypothetical protein
LAQFHCTVFVFFGSFTVFTIYFGQSTTEETYLVEMRIWCIKIGIVLVLHHLLTGKLEQSECETHQASGDVVIVKTAVACADKQDTVFDWRSYWPHSVPLYSCQRYTVQCLFQIRANETLPKTS